jgi:DNA helicase-2/ATP-dependent DNA helicase PcrA
MPLDPAQIQAAQAAQHAAARDQHPQVRLVAGPGTGKSSAIEERIRWLLAQGVGADTIFGVSFTRAAALDLRRRIQAYCCANGQPSANNVRVSTLHSLALRTLRAAGLLTAYPADPLVMDPWELENVFDEEFGHATGLGKKRREAVRGEHEAFWSTGQWGPPNYVPPNPPITTSERNRFNTFHGPRTQAYSCVLPGEIVRQCVVQMAAGTLDPVALLNIQHLVVDEFQDLNPMDLQFVDEVAARGAHVFVAGDDDQSIYSFRFASPAGIQNFVIKYPQCGAHTLNACFRSTPAILAVGQSLIAANAQPNRIPKAYISLYATANPAVPGVVHRWQFATGVTEARAIAASCRDLIAAGLNPRDVLILLGNQRVLLPALHAEFASANVEYEPPQIVGFAESKAGRWLLSTLRIVSDADDYVAHRVLLGLRVGIGTSTCAGVTDAVIAHNLNYRDLFYQPLAAGVFVGRLLTALNAARAVCTQIQTWQKTDTVAQHLNAVSTLLGVALSAADAQAWQVFAAAIPADMNLEELRDYLWADTDEQQSTILQAVFQRLDLPVPAAGVLPPRVRVMTMHGAKGLSAKVVFVPGLEEAVLPGPWRQPYPGLVLEAARLLYVAVTRARAACVLSYARSRTINGQFGAQVPSRFAAHVGGAFAFQVAGLNSPETAHVMSQIAQL